MHSNLLVMEFKGPKIFFIIKRLHNLEVNLKDFAFFWTENYLQTKKFRYRKLSNRSPPFFSTKSKSNSIF